MITLCNWDFYQDKKIRLELADAPQGSTVSVDIDNREKYSLNEPFRGTVSLDLPAGSYAVISLEPDARYAKRDAKQYSGGELVAAGPQLQPNPGLKYFLRSMNSFIRSDMKKYPDAGFREWDYEAWSTRNDDL